MSKHLEQVPWGKEQGCFDQKKKNKEVWKLKHSKEEIRSTYFPCTWMRNNLLLGWNILETNRTVGGLFGYSSLNWRVNLNVPDNKTGVSISVKGHNTEVVSSERQASSSDRIYEPLCEVVHWRFRILFISNTFPIYGPATIIYDHLFPKWNVFQLWQISDNFTTTELTQSIRELAPRDVHKKVTSCRPRTDNPGVSETLAGMYYQLTQTADQSKCKRCPVLKQHKYKNGNNKRKRTKAAIDYLH